MSRHGARLRVALQRIRDGFQSRHVGAGPADAGGGAQDQAPPKSVRDEGKAEMRQRRQARADDIDIAGGNTIRQRDKDGNGNYIGREEDADQRTGLGLGQMPPVDIGRQQRGKREGADLHQHLGRDDRPDELSREWRVQAVYRSARDSTDASVRRSASNAASAARKRPADTTTTSLPNGSIKRPKASGANAWQMRDGAPISPSR